jgi:putative DNA primase/helicase
MTRPTVIHQNGMLPEAITLTLDAIAKTPELHIYRYADGLIRLHPNESTGCVTMNPLDVHGLVEVGTLAAEHLRYDARSGADKPINCPRQIADGILSRKHWPMIPELIGICEAAFIDPKTGAIVCEPGFHRPTGIFLATAGQLTTDIILDPIKTLNQHFETFPSKAECDQSAAIAAVMTALNRRLLPSAPMFAVSAPSPGYGKSLLVDCVSVIATGRRAAVLSQGVDEAEFSKRIYGACLEGDAIISVDNVARPIGREDVLAQLLSQPKLRFRRLGGSGLVTVRTNSTVFSTGNSLSVVGDTRRRTVMIRLDCGLEKPETRTFDKDILAETHKRRDRLIAAALLITERHLKSKRSPQARPLGGFEEWDRLVRQPILAAGLADPLEGAADLHDNDPDIENTRSLLHAWSNTFTEDKSVAEVLVEALASGVTSGRSHANPELYASVDAACGSRIDARRLGLFMRSHRDRICDGLVLRHAGLCPSKKVALWKVEKV